MFAPLEIDVSHLGVATVTLNRPEVFNALSAELIAQLTATLRRLKQDSAVRVLVLTGKGKAFCAGADLRDPELGLDLPAEKRGQSFLESCDRGVHALARAMMRFGKPTVVAVNGPAVGGGSSLALSGNIVVAGQSAYFQQPFVTQLGLGPDMGGSWHLMRRLGPGRAVGAVLLGERIDAERAAQWGLIWSCVADDQVLTCAQGIAGRLAAGPTQTLARVPLLMACALENSFDEQLNAERDLQAHLIATPDFTEAIEAFRQKRKPDFSAKR